MRFSLGYYTRGTIPGMNDTIRLIDTHTHLGSAQFDEDRSAVLERAIAEGVRCIIETGYDLATSRTAITLAAQHESVYAVVGVQPNHVVNLPNDWLDQVRDLALQPKVVAIGEIGLDYYWKVAPADVQEAHFRAQLDLARDLGLPVVIHSRDAHDDTVRVLHDAARGLSGMMHSFSGGWEYARACLDLGFYLSFSGPVTFAKAVDLHEVVRRAPLDRILTETDSPYLAPHPFRGKRNEPAYVRLIAERIAVLRSMSLSELTQAVWRNASAMFHL